MAIRGGRQQLKTSSGITLVFTAAAAEEEMQAVETALNTAGLGPIDRMVHRIPPETKFQLAPASVEIMATREVVDLRLSQLSQGVAAIRRQLPQMGLMIELPTATGKAFYAWQQTSSADDVAAGAAQLNHAPDSPGAYGWDVGSGQWIRV